MSRRSVRFPSPIEYILRPLQAVENPVQNHQCDAVHCCRTHDRRDRTQTTRTLRGLNSISRASPPSARAATRHTGHISRNNSSATVQWKHAGRSVRSHMLAAEGTILPGRCTSGRARMGKACTGMSRPSRVAPSHHAHRGRPAHHVTVRRGA